MYILTNPNERIQMPDIVATLALINSICHALRSHLTSPHNMQKNEDISLIVILSLSSSVSESCVLMQSQNIVIL